MLLDLNSWLVRICHVLTFQTEICGSVWIGRGGGFSATAIPLKDVFEENKALEIIDR